MRENWKRILAGLLAIFVIGQLTVFFLPVYEASESDSLADIESHKRRFIVAAYVWQFIAVTVGGFIARRKFVIPALIYVAIEWVYGVLKGHMVASVVGMKIFRTLESRRISV